MTRFGSNQDCPLRMSNSQPCQAQRKQFADPRALVDAGLRRGQPRDAGGFFQRRAGMRTAIEQREELAVDMEHDDVAAVDVDDLVAAGRNVRRARDDVTGHVVLYCDQNL